MLPGERAPRRWSVASVFARNRSFGRTLRYPGDQDEPAPCRRRPGRPVVGVVLLAAAGALLAACGGGGGGGGGDPRTAPGCIPTERHGCLSPAEFASRAAPIARAYEADRSFSNQPALRRVGAHDAWARLRLLHGADGDPGAGQTVGFIDTGIDTGHPVFAGKTVDEIFMPGPYETQTTDEDGSAGSHGTTVASVAAGRPSAAYAESMDAPAGIAWGADIAMFVYDSATSRAPVPVDPPPRLTPDRFWANWMERPTVWSRDGRRIDFVTLGVVMTEGIERSTEEELRSRFPLMIAAFAQTGAREKTVFVIPAGNRNGEPCNPLHFGHDPTLCVNGRYVARSPTLQPGLPASIPELRGHLLAVVSVGQDGEIAAKSNRCGIAAQWCLAAPGDAIQAAYFGPDSHGNPAERSVRPFSGTSVAAPLVAGALVLMKQRFRGQLSNTALVQRLLETADRRGIYAKSEIYGQGLLDLDAATAPVGGTDLALGGRVDGPGVPVARTRFVAGHALGDGPARALAGWEIAAFDALGAPFWYALDDFAAAAPGAPATARLHAFMAPDPGAAGPAETPPLRRLAPAGEGAGRNGLRLGVLDARAPGLGGGHLSLAGDALALNARAADGLGVTGFSSEGMRGRTPVSGALVSWRPAGRVFALAGGWTAERETMLGSRPEGAFGRLSSHSAFLGLEGGGRAGAWRLEGGAELGIAATAPRGGMLTRLSPLLSSAFALRAERSTGAASAFRIEATQPLRVESGQARLSLPVGRGKDGRVLRRPLAADLAPSGRQVDLAARWRTRLSPGGELRLGASWTRHPGHDADAAPELALLAGWRMSF